MNKVPCMFFPASIMKYQLYLLLTMRGINPARIMTLFSFACPWTQEAQSYKQITQLRAQWSSCCVHGEHDVHLLVRELGNLQTQGTLKTVYSAVDDSQCLIPIFIYLPPKLSTFVPHASFSSSRQSNESHTMKPGSAQKKFLPLKERNPNLLFWELIWVTHFQLFLPSSSERGNENLLV